MFIYEKLCCRNKLVRKAFSFNKSFYLDLEKYEENLEKIKNKLSLTKLLKLNLKFKEEYINNKMKAAVTKLSSLAQISHENKQTIDLGQGSVDSEVKSLELKETTRSKRFGTRTFEPIIEEEKENNLMKID